MDKMMIKLKSGCYCKNTYLCFCKSSLMLGLLGCSKKQLPNIIRLRKAKNGSVFCKRLHFRCNAMVSIDETSRTRRFVVRGAAASALALLTLRCGLMLEPARAEESANEEGKDEGLVGALQSLLDPNEKSKSGKVLPKAYLKSAREVVKTLRESLQEDTKDMAKFRRTADAAKESIREYLNGWRGQKAVVNEESYVMLEKAIRSLAGFYSKAGPSAPLPEEVKSEILSDLTTAEESL